MRVRMTAKRCGGLALLAWVGVAGCVFQVVPRNDTNNQGPSSISVKIINSTGKPLDPQMYIGRVDRGLGLLFASVNKRTDFGVGTTGVLLPDKTGVLDVECGGPVYIATQGGAAGDNLNAPDAQGQQIVLEEGLNIRCGDQITFTFNAAGGAIETTYAVKTGS
jgi:hypothetical protein